MISQSFMNEKKNFGCVENLFMGQEENMLVVQTRFDANLRSKIITES